MTDRIEITGIEVWARHGVLEEEKAQDQPFVVDVQLSMDLGPAGSSDRLADTVDYGELVRRIHSEVAGTSHDLIETVAEGIAGIVLADERVERVLVTVHKPRAPIEEKFGDVSVTIDRGR